MSPLNGAVSFIEVEDITIFITWGEDSIKRKGFHRSLGQKGATRKAGCKMVRFQKPNLQRNSRTTA